MIVPFVVFAHFHGGTSIVQHVMVVDERGINEVPVRQVSPVLCLGGAERPPPNNYPFKIDAVVDDEPRFFERAVWVGWGRLG